MNPEKRISIGAFLAAFGSIGIIFIFLLSPPDLGRPWEFLIAFTLGVMSGLGAALSIHSLLERRHNR
jgi:hypothetical protein